MAFRLKFPKLDRKTLTIGGIGLGLGIVGYYLFLAPRGGLSTYIPGIPNMDQTDTPDVMGAMEGEYESGLFVSYDDGFTVGNRVTVS